MKAVDWQASIQRVLQAARTLKIRQDAQQGDVFLSAQRGLQHQKRRLVRVSETETPEDSRIRATGDGSGRGGGGGGASDGREPDEGPDETEPGKGQKLDRRA